MKSCRNPKELVFKEECLKLHFFIDVFSLQYVTQPYNVQLNPTFWGAQLHHKWHYR